MIYGARKQRKGNCDEPAVGCEGRIAASRVGCITGNEQNLRSAQATQRELGRIYNEKAVWFEGRIGLSRTGCTKGTKQDPCNAQAARGPLSWFYEKQTVLCQARITI